MLVTTYKAKKNRYSAKNHLGISLFRFSLVDFICIFGAL